VSYRIGVLSVQGDFAEHVAAMNDLEEVDAAPVKTKKAIETCDGLIIPGGESTTIGKLCERFGLDDAISKLHAAGKPIWGTCAGLILLAKDIVDSEQWRLGYMDIQIKRNAFGRQVDSFETDLPIKGIEGGQARAVFIRAPAVTKAQDNVEVLATFRDSIVMVRQDHLLGTTFHPELTEDRRVQQYFLDMVKASASCVGSD